MDEVSGRRHLSVGPLSAYGLASGANEALAIRAGGGPGGFGQSAFWLLVEMEKFLRRQGFVYWHLHAVVAAVTPEELAWKGDFGPELWPRRGRKMPEDIALLKRFGWWPPPPRRKYTSKERKQRKPRADRIRFLLEKMIEHGFIARCRLPKPLLEENRPIGCVEAAHAEWVEGYLVGWHDGQQEVRSLNFPGVFTCRPWPRVSTGEKRQIRIGWEVLRTIRQLERFENITSASSLIDMLTECSQRLDKLSATITSWDRAMVAPVEAAIEASYEDWRDVLEWLKEKFDRTADDDWL